jgi:hypothetical protein
MGSTPDKSLMRSLGEFFGHIVRGVKAPVEGAERHEVRREVQEETWETAQGKVTLRRTTIEEVVIDPDAAQTPPRDEPGRRGQE